jgi:hypothetical protein
MSRKCLWSIALGTAGGLVLAGNVSLAASSKPALRLLSSVEIPRAVDNKSGGPWEIKV